MIVYHVLRGVEILDENDQFIVVVTIFQDKKKVQ